MLNPSKTKTARASGGAFAIVMSHFSATKFLFARARMMIQTAFNF
jgi:hypothetical protein